MNGYVATIGMFDGVHRGHQFVLQQVVEKARALGLQSMAITFDHGLRGEPVLTPLDAKRLLLLKTGIDRVEVLSFNDELRQMTAREFMEHVLRDQFHVRLLMTGYDNRFGHDRREGFNDYVRYGNELGIGVEGLPQASFTVSDGAVSSSLVRQQLLQGLVSEAAACLGYPYTITGHVAHGEHVGTTLGFPTANIVPDDACQLIPAAGVYAVKVRLEHAVGYKHAMMNVGTRPTFGGHHQTLEVHIFQLHDNLYGQQLSVSFVQRLREERRFESSEALRMQLQQDACQVEEYFRNISEQEID